MVARMPGPKFEVLRGVLARAFKADGLRELARVDLPAALGEIDWDQADNAVAFDLLEWAEQTGNVDNLIQAVSRRRSDNACVKAIHDRWPAWLQDPEPTAACEEAFRDLDETPPPPPGPRIPPVLGGVVLLVIVAAVGYVIYQANSGNGTTTPTAQQNAGNVTLRNLRVMESATGRTFLAELLQLNEPRCIASDTCIQEALRTWLGENNADTAAVDKVPTYVNTTGLVFRVDADFTGLAGVKCPVSYSVYDVAGDAPREIQDSYLVNEPGFPYSAVTPEGESDAEQLEFWIPLPPRNGLYQLQLTVHEGPNVAGSIPEVVNSNAFRIDGGKWVAAAEASVMATP